MNLSLKLVGAQFVRNGLEDLSREIPKISRQRIYSTLVRVRHRLKQPGKPSTSPVRWDSEKQRRYVMAKLRREGNLPYRRTGRYQQAWTLSKSGNLGYRLHNDLDHAQHIGGDFAGRYQSSIHRGRWEVANEVFTVEIETLPAEIEGNIASHARRVFG